MADRLPGSYQHIKSENLEQFLAATNVPLIVRKVVSNTNPKVDITKDGETWSITFKVMFKTNTLTFVIGKEFSETNPITSETSKCLASIDDQGTLQIREESTRGVSFRTISASDEGLTIELKAEGVDVQAKRSFKRTSK